ncbi:uncharacterized protein LAESUDRAFT_730235 [Laetiporus sulphureus 93-53]|uniref:VHS domain-containing protein n=1 Tax=Laetiporus sulphureus 93-53 TaxID=1314785 RepID=A0A165CB25_9APHY|nr:uncharacterized protein LAESUDRAFT_730235 [Laetiporus sulphureus 93-53]KZT02488.1 hypothetical protein LAESUDRAFT_730235 [Laetiporus sulphureus 93-53]
MSAMQLAKQAYTALNRDKPHSSITDWVEILTSTNYDAETYDGIPELVDSINIQATGPAEASRAIRKKLKHGNSHQQYRALVILGALVENGGHKFQTTFADSHLMDALKVIATEPQTDPKVKKKLVSVLHGWHAQFKDDPSMTLVANLYKACGVGPSHRAPASKRISASYSADYTADPIYKAEERQRRDDREKRERDMEERAREKETEKKRKEEEKQKAKEEKERKKRQAEMKKKAVAGNGKVKRKPFDFDQETPQILTAIAAASQASTNLVNAITLVNTEHDSVAENERVQECLGKAKISRRQIVRYIQLVENEDMIGALIEANDRIIAALDMYDTLTRPNITEQDVQNVQEGLAAANIQDSELGKLQEKQRAAVQRSMGRTAGANGQSSRGKEKDLDDSENTGHSYVHPDLQDLSFGSLGAEQSNLPPPLRPSTRRSSDEDSVHRGSLSDFSDYDSSDEEANNHSQTRVPTSSHGRGYSQYVAEDEDVRQDTRKGLLSDSEDPFADP